MARIAINGLGRIGRSFLKAALARPELEVVAVNDLGDPENLAYLLRFDSAYGRFGEEVAVEEGEGGGARLVVGGRGMRFLRERDPARLPWAELGVDVVVEATGVFETYEEARVHLRSGARRVVLTAPAKDEDGPDARTVLVGVNLDALGEVAVSSNGSCTTNSASPLMQVLGDTVGVKKAMLNTVHGYTATQSLVDAPARGKDMRRGRAAAANIVPASTGAATAVARAIPSLRGRFDGVAMRVPVLSGSLSAIVFVSGRPTTAEEINGVLEEAARQPRWRGLLAVTRDQLVSSDIVGEPHAAIVDLSLTKVVDGDLCSVYSWYDNERGFTTSLVEHVAAVAQAAESAPAPAAPLRAVPAGGGDEMVTPLPG
ncbi:MAG TPA: glyceraldehyde 3-phosphate dehydrogenase NAD-binding domain-containing protein [Longimicrobiaceae bacterium]|jgi:glyceraldehyde 3-phosphate dehydrogenase